MAFEFSFTNQRRTWRGRKRQTKSAALLDPLLKVKEIKSLFAIAKSPSKAAAVLYRLFFGHLEKNSSPEKLKAEKTQGNFL